MRLPFRAIALGAFVAGAATATAISPAGAQSLFDFLAGRTEPVQQGIPREEGVYTGKYAPGTIVISLAERRLYLIEQGGKALRYGVGVGRPGFEWSGIHAISSKKKDPAWTPPKTMLARRPDLPRYMKGGPDNPLGARALYLGSSIYRIHGSNEPDTIGQAVSSGCIRMLNADVIDLYDRVKVGTKVVVLKGPLNDATAAVQ